jgi:hypothetical protein
MTIVIVFIVFEEIYAWTNFVHGRRASLSSAPHLDVLRLNSSSDGVKLLIEIRGGISPRFASTLSFLAINGDAAAERG